MTHLRVTDLENYPRQTNRRDSVAIMYKSVLQRKTLNMFCNMVGLYTQSMECA